MRAHVVAAEDGRLTDVTRRYVKRWSDVLPHRAHDYRYSLDPLLMLLGRDGREDPAVGGCREEVDSQDEAAREEAREFWQVSLSLC